MKEKEYFKYNGKVPFLHWLNKLTDGKRAVIDNAIDDVLNGKTGKVKNLKGGLYEIRLHTEGGLRVYFTEHNNTIIVLFYGGDKGSQTNDIAKARLFLSIWEAQNEEEK